MITHVATTPAPKTDEAMTERIQEELHQADIPPQEHFVDAGYVSARVLVNSQERFGIEVVGPVSVDTQWQSHTPSGIDAREGRLGLGAPTSDLSTGENEYQLELGEPQESS